MKTKKRKRINWTYYIIEIAVVFIGVTAGFLLNNWRLDQADIKLEQQYLSGFYDDVIDDKESLDSLIFRSQNKSDTLIEILKITEVINEPLTQDLAKSIVLQFVYIDWLSSANDTYKDIINSGNLNLISDYKLKKKLSSYYSILGEVKNVEQFYREHINNYCFPILYKSYHLYKQTFIDESSYQSMEFTNMYLGVISLNQQKNIIYRKALTRNLELKEELAKAISINH